MIGGRTFPPFIGWLPAGAPAKDAIDSLGNGGGAMALPWDAYVLGTGMPTGTVDLAACNRFALRAASASLAANPGARCALTPSVAAAPAGIPRDWRGSPLSAWV